MGISWPGDALVVTEKPRLMDNRACRDTTLHNFLLNISTLGINFSSLMYSHSAHQMRKDIHLTNPSECDHSDHLLILDEHLITDKACMALRHTILTIGFAILLFLIFEIFN